MMRAAWPFARVTVGAEPAGMSATTLKVKGDSAAAVAESTARMANPSMDELLKRAGHAPQQYPPQGCDWRTL